MSRAGWPGGKFSAVKLWKSSSMSGPSATENPMSAKIAVSSSMVWVIGWMRPCCSARTGRVTSIRSASSRSASAARCSSALRMSRAAPTSSFSAFIA